MSAEVRLGDYERCNCPHGGIAVVTTASGDVITDNQGAARVGDICVCCSCGCTARIISGSGDVIIDGKSTARVDDSTSGTCNPGFPCCGKNK